jgi:glycosyltransferase involved in cell wall biosynthesis
VSTASIVVICKDEPSVLGTLEGLAEEAVAATQGLLERAEIVVVDASSADLSEQVSERARAAAPVRWIRFRPPAGVRTSIPHQRNAGIRAAKGDIIVFTDCGCTPATGWLEHLVKPIVVGEEEMVSGRTGPLGKLDPYAHGRRQQEGARYLRECSTINLAVRREVFDAVGGFDESFEYGSDVDFSWRAVHAGVRIRYAPQALVRHDWGTRRRQLKRAFVYGKARARLYHKHVIGRSKESVRKRRLDEADAVPLLYSLYVLGLPLALWKRWYLLLPLATVWRARRERPVATMVDHMVLGAGVLAGAFEIMRGR